MPNYKEAYSGQKLLEKHSLDTYGTWRIYGEDPNCDAGDRHHEPFLDTVEGRLQDVIAYAEGLKRFWQWGAGGRIELQATTVKRIKSGYSDTKAIQERAAKRQALEDQLRKIQEELENL